MASKGIISAETHVRGRVTGDGDLDILGRVDGDVTLDGDVLIDASGLVAANVKGRTVVVRGAVRGDLTGEEAVVLEDGARVVGDLRAPRIAVAPGALVRGYVQTAGIEAAAPKSSAKTASQVPARAGSARSNAPLAASSALRSPAPVAARAEARAPVAPVAPVSSVPSGAPLPPAPPSSVPAAQTAHARPAGPPAPIVPALRKGARGTLAKKRLA